MHDVKFVNVVKYDELSVLHLYEKLIMLEGMAVYFPSSYPQVRSCDRSYMFNVANTLHYEVVQNLIKHALKVRHTIDAESMKEERIMTNDHWEKELNSLPVVKRVRYTLCPNFVFRIKEG